MVSRLNEEIIKTFENDRRAGMRMLFDHYYHQLVVYSTHILHHHHQAEDIVQDFFVRLWEDNYLQKVSAEALTSYLFTAVRNSSLTFCTQKDILRDREELTGIDLPVEAFKAIDDERIERVMQEIALLPERTQQVVECVMLRELKYKEAAAELNISVNTVKFLLKEGTRRLRCTLNKDMLNILFFFFSNRFSRKE
ncbi:MAG: sigma-70 family RNA polymerase sigma factor [Odoribacter sp.]